MTLLLVSVRNAAEAEAALRGGAGLIDVKEPANGPLGKADDAVIAEVVRAVGGRVPVSAALGELPTGEFAGSTAAVAGLTYVKIGLARRRGAKAYAAGRAAGCTQPVYSPRVEYKPWHPAVASLRRAAANRYPGAQLVVAAYGDWAAAGAPPVEEVYAYAREQAGGVVLVDTFAKGAGRTLLDWLSPHELANTCARCRAAGVQTALAGSLGLAEIGRLLPLRPDWIAVRGAACEGGRHGVVSEAKVREIVALINRPGSES
jgi:uncharacterized protein (UPF0264 family)